MKKYWRKIASAAVTCCLTVLVAATTFFGGNIFEEISGLSEVEAAEIQLQNPRIETDSSMTAGQKVTWDCVWFGSYPQTEVVSEENTEQIAALENMNTYYDDTAYEVVSAEEFAEIESAAEDADSEGDFEVGSEKYRRIKYSDATYATSDERGYYDWNDDEDFYHYFKYEPIKWRVLDVANGKALLLADVALDDQEYNTEDTDITWKYSTIRSFLNNYGSSANTVGTDYSSKGFLKNAFTASEQSAIEKETIENADNLEYDTEGGNDTSDQIFLLSETDCWGDKASSYGFVNDRDTSDEARRSKTSTYAFAMGTYRMPRVGYTGNCTWWLRSPGDDSGDAARVDHFGMGSSYVSDDNYGVRPALYLDLSYTEQYSYAGTVCSDGTVKLGFEYPEDAWGFTNSDTVFETDEDGDEDKQGYQISNDDLQRLVSHLTETEAMAVLTSPSSEGEMGTAKFKSRLNLSGFYTSQDPFRGMWSAILGEYDEWGGSCYGMSYYAVLNQQRIRSISELGSSEKVLEDVKFSDEVESAINFYQVQQYLPYSYDNANEFMQKTAEKQLEQLESLALDAQNGGMPVVIRFQWYMTNDGSDGNTAGTVLARDDEGNLIPAGHAVIGYGVEYSEEGFSVDGVYDGQETYPKRIKISDPSAGDGNEADDRLFYLYFDDEGHWYIPGWHAHSSTNDREEKLSNNADFVIATASENVINAVDYQTGKTSFSDNLTTGYLTFSKDSSYTLTWKTKTCTVKNGIITAGEKLNIIQDAAVTAEGTSSDGETIFLPESDTSYTITSDEPLSFTLYQGDYFEAVNSTEGGTVTIGANGSVTLEDAQDSEYQIMLTANDSPLAYSTAYVSGTADEKVSVSVDGDGVKVSGASAADTDGMSVAFASRTDSLTVPETAYSGNSEITVEPGQGKQIIVNGTAVGEIGTDSKSDNNSNTGSDSQNATKKGISVSKITLSGISKKIAAGKEIKLTAKITPANASNKGITWKSSNKKVATVTQKGVVKIKKGTGGKTVTITATAKDGSGKKAKWKIRVMKGVVKKIKITGKKKVKAGKSLKLKAKVTATKGANKKLRWTSSNTKYATVSQSGKVKTKKAGKGKKVKITAMATDGSGKKKTVTIRIK